MEDSKCSSVPMQEKANLSKAQGEKTPSESAKQSTIAMYYIEAEYIAAAEASMEVVWMRKKFIDEHGNVVPTNKKPMEMLCDNIAAIAIANDPGIMKKVHTNDNVADPFTKPMQYTKRSENAMGIEIRPASSFM
ncbi:hypothetical protein Tco_0393477 [Tanacetum coccineum]